MNINEKMDGVLSYSIGGAAITLPMVINALTTGIHVLTMLCGLVVVIFRAIYEYRLYKKNKE